jgi:hypothetical protein
MFRASYLVACSKITGCLVALGFDRTVYTCLLLPFIYIFGKLSFCAKVDRYWSQGSSAFGIFSVTSLGTFPMWSTNQDPCLYCIETARGVRSKRSCDRCGLRVPIQVCTINKSMQNLIKRMGLRLVVSDVYQLPIPQMSPTLLLIFMLARDQLAGQACDVTR